MNKNKRKLQQTLSELWAVKSQKKTSESDDECRNGCFPTTASTLMTLTTDTNAVKERNTINSDITISPSREFEAAKSNHSFIAASQSLASGSGSERTDYGSGVSDFDVGRYVQSTTPLSDDLKHRLLTNPWRPTASYNFSEDRPGIKRCFRNAWLEQFSPWLSYSRHLKGPVCVFFVIFPQPVHRGYQGAFIVSAFTRYNDFPQGVRDHLGSIWHNNAQQDATAFLSVMRNPDRNILSQIDRSNHNKIVDNRKKLLPILSTIIFCGTHDIALRGKRSDSGNLQDLFQFRVEAGDKDLEMHLQTSAGNARYTSHRTQNELIEICQEVIQTQIVAAANKATCFSILADETADISGTEQLSLAVRFVENSGNEFKIREEFLGFQPLEQMTASTIADTILHFCDSCGLDMTKLLGQGYDGCSAMAGEEGGVQAIIRNRFPKAAFVHCSAHRLNLVVNDLNSVVTVRNTTGTIKAIIKFFRESTKRRSLIPNVPLLSETRWTSKYKSIRIFGENFDKIYNQLHNLATNSKGNTQQKAHQLLYSCTTPTFVICLVVISTYSAILEPVTQSLQAIQLDLLSVQKQILKLLNVLRKHRQNAEIHFKQDIYAKVVALAQSINVEMMVPRLCGRQVYRSNPVSSNNNNNTEEREPEDYFRQTIFVPYLDSIISSLTDRFSEDNSSQFHLFKLQPAIMKRLDRAEFKISIDIINRSYNIDNFEIEAMNWFDFWCTQQSQDIKDNVQLVDLLSSTDFFPAIRHALLIALTLPATTCTVERSFSTLRRVKTWLRSTMDDDRVSGLCLLSVHRQSVNSNKTEFMQKVIEIFGRDARRLQFLFQD